jgi:tetratricopeptide (TPR) repeat protein
MRPVWFSAVNYYVLSVAISLCCFFLICGIAHEVYGDTPWIIAGIISSVILIASVVGREIFMRRAFSGAVRQRDLRNLGRTVPSGRRQAKKGSSDRLTIDRNIEFLKDLETRSSEAKGTPQLPEPHMAVFDLCELYLRKSQKELSGMNKESPRYSALLNGRRRVFELHRFHLLAWASIESSSLIQRSKAHSAMTDKIDNAQAAIGVLETALQFYPDESRLLESLDTVKEFSASIRISHWIERAERAAFKEDYPRAINHYRDALFFLGKESFRNDERSEIAEKLNREIDRLRNLSRSIGN